MSYENKKTISGIVCEAKNCEYHTQNDGCSAEQIKVENKDACTSCETECHTFVPKKML